MLASPMQHPEPLYQAAFPAKWEEELALEKEMLSLGTERMQRKLRKAKEKKNMEGFRPYRSAITEWVIPVSEYLEAWCLENGGAKRGVRPIAQRLLSRVPYDTSAVCALRIIFRQLGLEFRGITGLAFEIGTWIEHEARAIAWRRTDEKSWFSLERYYKDRGSNAVHQKRSRTAIFNKTVGREIGWVDWTEQERYRVGLQMIDCVCKATKRFSMQPDPTADFRTHGKVTKNNYYKAYVLQPDPRLLERMSRAMDQEMVYAPVFLPTIIPPKPWVGPRDGGYWTPYVKTPFLIRFKAHQEDVRQRALDEFDAIDMPEVYAALNSVQETQWMINQRVLKLATEFWQRDLGICNMPTKKPLVVPARPCTKEQDEKRYREWSRTASSIHAKNATRFSNFIATDRTLMAAKRMAQEEVFYFPHMLDFRGRMYPIPSDLTPQGNDLNKGLLLFKEGKKVEREDAIWLAVNLANSFGIDKVSMEDRVKWVLEREDEWRAIDEDPYENDQWTSADGGDAPWQALAAIFEWAGYLRDPEGFLSHLPVRVDGSCNGIQHLSAMVRDEQGGRAVNLVPSDKPADVYSEVSARLTRALEQGMEDGEPEAFIWLALFEGQAPRSVSKRPVMILPYGGTLHAYFQYTLEWLDKHDPQHIAIAENETFKMVGYLVRKLWKIVGTHLPRPQEVMRWLQKNSALACETGKPSWWITPSGFHCRQFYGVIKSRQINTLIDGQRYQVNINEATNKLDPQAQAKAIAPNFVHSQDASCLTLAVNLAQDNGITAITTIHDSVGTHAADCWKLYGCLREAFIENYQTDVLGDFQEACKSLNPNAKSWPEPMEHGDLDLEAVRQSDYFFM
jgi:DNA-directed RNA polymerase